METSRFTNPEFEPVAEVHSETYPPADTDLAEIIDIREILPEGQSVSLSEPLDSIPHDIDLERAEDYARDFRKVRWAREDPAEFDKLFKEYYGFLRLKTTPYFIQGGTSDDLIAEAMLGFYKAVRDYDGEKSSFRNFADLCVSRQIITAVKTASRNKHKHLNESIDISSTAGPDGSDDSMSLEEMISDGSPSPYDAIIGQEGLDSLLDILKFDLSWFESVSIRMSIEGESYEDIAKALDTDAKTVDNALQRVKKKVKNGLNKTTL